MTVNCFCVTMLSLSTVFCTDCSINLQVASHMCTIDTGEIMVVAGTRWTMEVMKYNGQSNYDRIGLPQMSVCSCNSRTKQN